MSGMDTIKWGIGKGIVRECVCVWRSGGTILNVVMRVCLIEEMAFQQRPEKVKGESQVN